MCIKSKAHLDKKGRYAQKARRHVFIKCEDVHESVRQIFIKKMRTIQLQLKASRAMATGSISGPTDYRRPGFFKKMHQFKVSHIALS